MRITIYILNKGAEVYQKFGDVESAVKWLNRTGYLHQRIVIVQKGESAKVWERINDLTALYKEMSSYFFSRP